MKQLLTLSIITFLLTSCQPKNLPTVSDIHADYAEVKFSHMTTKDEMAKIKIELKSMSNIEFRYEQSQFLDDGHLQVLKIGVVMPDGTKASTSADLMKLQFNYYGFLYDPKSNPSASIGLM